MANMRAIRARIRSVSSTQQITKAMKMVAASKLRRVQGKMLTTRRMAEELQHILDQLLESDTELNNPLITPRSEVHKVCYCLFVGNRGLCGMYNTALFHLMQDIIARETRPMEMIVCGRWGKEAFRRFGMPVVKTMEDVSDTPDVTAAEELSKALLDTYLSGEYDEIHLVYQSYASALSQKPVVRQLLPISVQDKDRTEASPRAGKTEFLFEPDLESVLERILSIHMTLRVFAVLLESKCGEHSARVTAMSSATDNTDKLISKLRLSYNRARQAAITKEISEIVGGASALKKNKEQ